eukprot:354498-Chlamydomonas_euryale.AAC.2
MYDLPWRARPQTATTPSGECTWQCVRVWVWRNKRQCENYGAGCTWSRLGAMCRARARGVKQGLRQHVWGEEGAKTACAAKL